MPKPSGKINSRERQICARLKEFRERVRCSQSDFASQIGITRDQLAGIEYARTPLRYDIAWAIRSTIGVSLMWVAIGEVSPDLMELDQLPPPQSTGLPKTALLSEVYETFHPELSKGFAASPRSKPVGKANLDAADLKQRASLLVILSLQMEDVMAHIPDGYTDQFAGKVWELSKTYLEALPKDPPDAVRTRSEGIMWSQLASRIHRQAAEARMTTTLQQEKGLTLEAGQLTTSPVQPIMPTLLERLRQATATRGRKTELAGWLGVPRQSVNDWLTERKEPSGETTLRLLAWVTAEEAKQQQSPASGDTPAEPKAQVRNQYEKKPNSDPP